jgi:surface protein
MKKLALFFSFLFVISCSKDPIIYTLTTSANPAEGGTVSPSTQQFEEGETATITATPSSEYVFQSWSGATGSTNTTSIVMSSDKSVTANFIKKKYSLNVMVEGEGAVNEKVIKAGLATDYNSGTIVELTAVPSEEWLFLEWTGDITGTENPTQITIDKAKNVTAVFVKKQYPLTIEIEGEGTVTEKVIKAGVATDYNSGTVVELTATEKTGWEFKEWKGDLTGSENPTQITIDKAKNVTALFIKKPVAYLDENGITIKANSWAEVGDTVEIGGLTYTIIDETTLKQMIADDKDVTKVVTSKVTNMGSLFRSNSTFNQDIGSWDTSNVTNMNMLFFESQFNKDISKWDVSSVTDMGLMFRDSQFNGDISKWDVSNVTNMEQLFSSAKFTGDISEWNVSSLKNMYRLFFDAAFRGDISNWDVSSVTNMSSVFNSTINDVNFDLSKWDVSSVTDMSGLFWATDFNGDISSWDVSNVKNMNETFGNASSFNQDISSWNVSNVEDMGSMFMSARSFNQDLSSWDVSNVTNMNRMFSYALVFNQDLSKWCVTNISSEPTDFSTSSELTEANKPIWGTCPSESTIWNGTTITFTKADGANPEEEANQDRITDNIWITRGNDGGQIFNIKTETSYNKTDSPVGTKWAVGTLDEIETLTFKKFRAAVEKPNSSLVGKNLVMYLEEDDVYLSVKFTSWSEQKNGGFAYERSTKP